MTDERFLTLREAAGEMRCSPATAYALVRSGRLAAVRRGGPLSALLVPAEALDAYLYGPPEEEHG